MKESSLSLDGGNEEIGDGVKLHELSNEEFMERSRPVLEASEKRLHLSSSGTSLWTLSLVGYSIGQRPYYERLLSAMNKIWTLKGSLSLLSLADGFFLLKFTSFEDYEMVWSGGPWFLLGKPFILQKWSPKFNPNRDESSSIPIWIKILDLPLALWPPLGISKIASYIGIPLTVDSLTAKRTRLTFARDSTLPDEIPLVIDGEDLNLKVVYDWKPTRCEGCGSLIHPFTLCPSNPDPKHILPPKNVNRGRSRSRNPGPRIPRSSSKPPAAEPTNLSSPLSPIVEPPQTNLVLDSSTNSKQQNLITGKDPILPNLNFLNEETSSSEQPPPQKLMLPPQVILANSFASLPNE
ncbi:hypothetical protein M5K25_026453 [Dendrobium thyrsiflorum]|uniref:DUF4283 domain-containing protein n=1 Tax=Dendrobium thyrsiflorum TaxID=117978 RepID=A0ABD0TXK4_DENTH